MKQKRTCVTVVPVGGMGNRMRVMAGAVTLQQQLGAELQMVWFKDEGLNASFASLFKPFDFKAVKMVDDEQGCCVQRYDRPRRKNLYLPRLFQLLRYDACIYEKSVYGMMQSEFDFARWAENRDVYLATYSKFFPYAHSTLQQLFVPVDELQKLIDKRCAGFTSHTVGVHVRRTDHAEAIQASPLELFYERLDAEVNRCADTRIYLATDSEEVKQDMRARYGNRIICSEEKADRTSQSGIEEAIVELYALSRTQKIYGSFQSSFSEIASELGDVPLEMVCRA